MITFQAEDYIDVIDEIWPMLEAHYLEIATDREVKPFDPDLARYRAMEDQDMLRIFTAREFLSTLITDSPDPSMIGARVTGPTPRLIGYFISFVMPGLHYQQTMMAINDIMYVDPAHRKGTVGYRLIQQATEDLKNLGADVLTVHMKTDYPFRNLLIRLGFHLTEENWERVL